MKHEEFRVGGVFYTATGGWVCTDIGARVVVAIKEANLKELPGGPPFAWAETVFDEYDQRPCSLTRHEREPPGTEDRYQALLARRIPRDSIVLGRAYVIHARRGGVGVAVERNGRLGYRLHREKFGKHRLFVEYDWDEDPSHGTAIPLRAIGAEPPSGDAELLAWLAHQQDEHRAEIDAAWEVILGFHPSQLRSRRPRHGR